MLKKVLQIILQVVNIMLRTVKESLQRRKINMERLSKAQEFVKELQEYGVAEKVQLLSVREINKDFSVVEVALINNISGTEAIVVFHHIYDGDYYSTHKIYPIDSFFFTTVVITKTLQTIPNVRTW